MIVGPWPQARQLTPGEKYTVRPLTSRDAFVVQRNPDGAARLVTALEVMQALSASEAIEAAFARPPAGDLESDKRVTIVPLDDPGRTYPYVTRNPGPHG
jgi:hypothetical protein